MSLANKIKNLEDYKETMCRSLQAFLTHERLYNLNCLKRLHSPFKVIDFDATNSAGHINVKFEGGDKIFIKEADLKRYNSGQRNKAVRLAAIDETVFETKIVISVSLKVHNLSSLIKDMPKLRGVIINHNNKNYKIQDVQYEEMALGKVNDVVKLVLTDFFSAETFLNEKVVLRNKTTHVGNGINFESFGEQEAYVKLVDANDAVSQERAYVCQEIFGWFQEMGASNELMEELNKKIQTL